jgi:hypothetical protein
MLNILKLYSNVALSDGREKGVCTVAVPEYTVATRGAIRDELNDWPVSVRNELVAPIAQIAVIWPRALNCTFKAPKMVFRRQLRCRSVRVKEELDWLISGNRRRAENLTPGAVGAFEGSERGLDARGALAGRGFEGNGVVLAKEPSGEHLIEWLVPFVDETTNGNFDVIMFDPGPSEGGDAQFAWINRCGPRGGRGLGGGGASGATRRAGSSRR